MLNEQIGIDRMVISGFRIISVDLAKLRASRFYEYITTAPGESMYLLSDGTGFKKIKVVDNKVFGTLTAGVRHVGRKKLDYVKMDLTVPDGVYGNLDNVTVQYYQQYVQAAFMYLWEQYGIVVDFSVVTISSMEINCTIETREPFYQYRRALRVMMYNLPKTYKKLTEYSKIVKATRNIQVETFYRGNESIQVKVYDKSQQLRETLGIEPGKEYMRIEIILKKSSKIKSLFGTNCLWELTSKNIEDFFFGFFKKYFIDKYYGWKKNNRNMLKSMIKKYRNDNPANWISKLLADCRNEEQKKQVPVLLDIYDLVEAVKSMDKHRHHSRTCNSILTACLDKDVFLQEDTKKVIEIITKVENQYNNCSEGFKEPAGGAPGE